QVALLWQHIATHIAKAIPAEHARRLNIVPVQGSPSLSPSVDIVRLAGSRFLKEDDAKFLGSYCRLLDTEWLRYLTDAAEVFDSPREAPWLGVLEKLGLHQASDANKVVSVALRQIASTENSEMPQSLVRLAHLAAAWSFSV